MQSLLWLQPSKSPYIRFIIICITWYVAFGTYKELRVDAKQLEFIKLRSQRPYWSEKISPNPYGVM